MLDLSSRVNQAGNSQNTQTLGLPRRGFDIKSGSNPDHPDRAFGTAFSPLQGGEFPDSSNSPPCKGGEVAQSAVGVVRNGLDRTFCPKSVWKAIPAAFLTPAGVWFAVQKT